MTDQQSKFMFLVKGQLMNYDIVATINYLAYRNGKEKGARICLEFY